MVRSILFLLVLFLAAQTPHRLDGQTTFAPSGAEWWYGFRGGFIQVEGWTHFIYEKDTVAFARPCKKIAGTTFLRFIDSGDPYQVSQKPPLFFHQTGDSIFVLAGDTWMFRWRTSPMPGDTFNIQVSNNPNGFVYHVTVDSVVAATFNNQTINKIYIYAEGASPGQLGNSGHALLYDKFGSAFGDFFFYQCWGLLDCYPSSLCKYKDDNFPLYEFSSPVCDGTQVSGASETAAIPGIKASPNPCTDMLRFDLSTQEAAQWRLAIYDQQGRLLKEFVNDTDDILQIQVTDLQAGIYIYQLNNGYKVFSGRFIKS